MTPDSILLITQQALELILVIVLVVLLPALLVGLLVSMFQAATQINEMTLSFIPKLAVTLATLLLAGPWIIRTLADYTQNLFENIPYLIG
jgi:flagellar biosynthetic protein FliQ